MIDIENIVFNTVATRVCEVYPDIFITGEYVPSPPFFPAVSLMEMDNSVRADTVDSGSNENHVNVMYEANVYSNRVSGKKSEAKAIMGLIDEVMLSMGFARVEMRPVPNEYDSSIYRMVGRYRAAVSKTHEICRR